MGSSFLSPPKKRSSLYLDDFYSDISTVEAASIVDASRITHMTDPTLFSANGSPNRSKRPKQQYAHQRQPPSLIVPPGHVSFRLLCHASRIGGVIGKSGSVIKNLQQITGAKIRVEEAPPESPDRVVLIVASAAVTAKVVFKDPIFGGGLGQVDGVLNNGRGGDGDGDGDGEVFEISKAQEALLKVFDRILEVATETGGAVVGVGLVSCRLLADAAQVGAVIGKGGKVVEKIRKDTGCKVRVLNDKLPTCVDLTDEMVEIEGNIFSVRKALVAVSRRLQDCTSGDKTRTTGSKPLDMVPCDNLQNLHADHLPRSSLLTTRPNISHMHGGGVTSSSVEFDRVVTLDPKSVQQEVTFKILCSNDRVGGVIGKSGGIVKALVNETGASISVGPSVAECDERLITVMAHENPESRYSSAQKAVVLVFSRSTEAGNEKGQDSGANKRKSITARLVVPSNQVGCLLGKGGSVISEIRRVTGTGIRILGTDQAPKCVSEKDQVVLISGEYSNVQDALYNVTGRLRDNFLLSVHNSAGSKSIPSALTDTTSYGRLRETVSLTSQPSVSVGVSRNLNRHGLGSSIDYLGLPYTPDEMPSPRPWTVAGMTSRGTNDVSRGLGSLKGSIELGSGSKTAIVTNTTVEILVPENVIGCVYGDNGSNLARLRQISGAKVTVHEPLPGTSDNIVVISGTPDETQAAQSLLQAFILTGSS